MNKSFSFLLYVVLALLFAGCKAPATPPPENVVPVDGTSVAATAPVEAAVTDETGAAQPTPITQPEGTSEFPIVRIELSGIPMLADDSLKGQGPFLVYAQDMTLYAVSPKARAIIPLTDPTIGAAYGYAARPGTPGSGDTKIGYFAQTNGTAAPQFLSLNVSLGSSATITTLLPDEGAPDLNVVEFGSPVWSPDGTQIAFASAREGTSSDVYIYNDATQQISQVTSGETNAYDLSWSPDGRWVIHAARGSFAEGKNEQPVDIWASLTDGSLNVPLLRTVLSKERVRQELEIYGWLDSSTVVYGFPDYAVIGEVYSSKVDIGDAEVLKSNVSQIAVAESHGAILFSTNDPGHPLSLVINGQELPVSIPNGQEPLYLTWSPEIDQFFVSTQESIFGVNLSGEVIALTYGPPADANGYRGWHPVTSPDGAIMAWYGETGRGTPMGGLFVGQPGTIPQQVAPLGVERIIWSPDSQSFALFATTDGIEYSLWVASAPDFTPVNVNSAVFNEPTDDVVWIIP